MKALLVNPWIYDFAAYDLWLKPFGLLRIGAALRQAGWEVELLDCLDRFDPELIAYTGGGFLRHDSFGRGKYFKVPVEKPGPIAAVERPYFRYGLPRDLAVRRIARTPKPDLVLIGSTMTYWYPGYFYTREILREYLPGVPTILGGLYPRLCPGHARSLAGAETLPAEDGGEKLAAILNGLGFPSPPPAGGEETTPAYDLLRDRSALAVRTGRGCPYSCTYCGAALLEPQLRFRDPEAVAEEIIGYRDRFRTSDIAFYDNALLFNSSRHLDRILARVIERGGRLRFHTPNGLHARFLTRRTAELMREAGFVGPRLSLESAGKERQERTGGKVDNSDLIRALDCLEQAGFPRPEVAVYLMIGLPGQGVEEAERDIRFVHSLGATAALAAFSPIPGTADYLALKQAGVIPEDLDPLWQNNTIFSTRQGIFTLEVIRRLRQMAGELNRGLPGAEVGDKL